MSQDQQPAHVPSNLSSVNLNSNEDVMYWTKKFNVSEMQLITAVKEFGTSAEQIKEHFEKTTH